jgi:hypothetical protein
MSRPRYEPSTSSQDRYRYSKPFGVQDTNKTLVNDARQFPRTTRKNRGRPWRKYKDQVARPVGTAGCSRAARSHQQGLQFASSALVQGSPARCHWNLIMCWFSFLRGSYSDVREGWCNAVLLRRVSCALLLHTTLYKLLKVNKVVRDVTRRLYIMKWRRWTVLSCRLSIIPAPFMWPVSFSLLSLFWKIKGGLWDHLALCAFECP